MPINKLNLDTEVQEYIGSFENYHDRPATDDEVRMMILIPAAVAQVRSLQAHVLNNINGSGSDTTKAARLCEEFQTFENMIGTLKEIVSPNQFEYMVGDSLHGFEDDDDTNENSEVNTVSINRARGN